MAYRKCDDCPYAEKPVCPIQNVMLEVRNAIADILDHYTLEDFTQSIRKHQQTAKTTRMKRKTNQPARQTRATKRGD
jgi:DNA-binding IscR family transcriptional regulator